MNLEPSKTGFIRFDETFDCVGNAFTMPFVWFTSKSVMKSSFPCKNNFGFLIVVSICNLNSIVPKNNRSEEKSKTN